MNNQRAKLLVNFFEKLSLQSHKISGVDMLSKNSVQVNFSQINFKENVAHNFSNIYNLQDKIIKEKINQFPISITPSTQQKSPNKKYRVILQQLPDATNPAKKKQILEIYNQNNMIQQLNLDQYHEKIENNPMTGKPFIWNDLNTKFLYIANPKQEKGKNYLDLDFEKKEDLQEAWKMNEYQQDSGEQMVGTFNPKIFQYDIEEQKLERINIPEGILPCYPSFANKEGTKIIFSAFKIPHEFRYGILHCFNRESHVYLLEDVQKETLFPKKKEAKNENESQQQEEQKKPEIQFKIISKDEVSLRPSVSPDYKKVLYFGTNIRGPHLNYLGLKQINLEDLNVSTVFDFSEEYKQGQFMGICGFYDHLKDSYWVNDSLHFVFSTIQEGQLIMCLVNTSTSKVKQVTPKFLNCDLYTPLAFDASQNLLFASYENIIKQSQLAVLNNLDDLLNLQDLDQFQPSWQIFETQESDCDLNTIQKLLNDLFTEEILQEGEAQGNFCYLKDDVSHDLPFPQILKDLWQNNESLNLLKLKQNQKPLVVLIHGGPHGSSLGSFALSRLYFLLNGYNVLSPNFTGSCGYGQKFIENLLGKIGELDLQEISGMVKQIISRNMCDPKKVISYGGSYGGYMGGIIASRQYDLFRCAVLLNPCVNLAFMVNITDIPEWIVAECLGEQKMKWNLTPEDYAKIIQKSPMLSPARIPILLLLGQLDVRVPYQASLAYAAQSKSIGTEVKTYVYPQSDHRLDDSLTTSFNVLMNAVTFMEDQLGKDINKQQI